MVAPIGDRYHRGDHLLLPPCQRKLGRHQCAECGEGVVESIRYQAVRGHDARRSIVDRMHRSGIFNGIQSPLSFECAARGSSASDGGSVRIRVVVESLRRIEWTVSTADPWSKSDMEPTRVNLLRLFLATRDRRA